MKTPAPRWVCLQLLEACNLRCTMCYEWGTHGTYKELDRRRELSFDVVERVIRDLAPYAPHFDLFGGEPLLYSRIADVVRLIKNIGCSVDIATNGTPLVDLADTLVDAAVDRLWVSVDGPEAINDRQRGKGTFAAVMQGIAAVRNARARSGRRTPRIGITFIVTPVNHAAIEETFLRAIDRALVDEISIEFQSYLTSDQLGAYDRLLRERFHAKEGRLARGLLRDVADFSAIDPEKVARQIESVRSTYEADGKRVITKPRVPTAENGAAYFSGRFEAMSDHHARCVFPWLYAEVSATGDVTPCHTFYDLTFGNVYEQSILEVWRSERFEEARRYFRSNLSPVCQACCLYHTEPSVPSS